MCTCVRVNVIVGVLERPCLLVRVQVGVHKETLIFLAQKMIVSLSQWRAQIRALCKVDFWDGWWFIVGLDENSIAPRLRVKLGDSYAMQELIAVGSVSAHSLWSLLRRVESVMDGLAYSPFASRWEC